MSNAPAAAKAKPGKDPALVHRKPLKTRLKENWQLYLLLLIPVIITIVYKYGPMYGIQIAFRDFKASRGIWGSEWVGLEWFQRFFSSPNCGRMIVNTVLISLYSLLWSFPVPIILALALNQLRFHKLKRVVQTVLYAPHFISTMIICGMLRIFLSPSGGLINLLLGGAIHFVGEERISQVLLSGSVFQPFVAALIGFIPNCASSVILTELYLAGSLSFGAAVAGLCTGAGVGLAVLWKANRHPKENLLLMVLLYGSAVCTGLLSQAVLWMVG